MPGMDVPITPQDEQPRESTFPKDVDTPPPAVKRTRFFTLPYLLGFFIPVAFGFGILSGYVAWGREPKSSPDAQAVQRYDVPVDDDPILGPKKAEITLIEFSDYECPYCQKWHNEVFERLMDEFPGKIRFVYRDFPLSSIHPNAEPAAEAANCAFEQGKFWEFHDKLFGGELGLGASAYMQYAQELGLDMNKFEECFDSARYQQEVRADLEWATNLGVRSTPTFFLNGIPIVGAQPFEVFKQVVEKELAGEIPK